MKNLFIPAGTVVFPGSYEELLHRIDMNNGTLKDEDSFQCRIHIPPKHNRGVSFIRVRGRMSFLFRCTFLRQGNSCEIHYKMYPTQLMMIFLFLVIYQLVTLEKTPDVKNILGSVFAFGIILVIYIIAGRFAIRQFVKKFTMNL